MSSYDLIIVGAGPAGLAASITARERGLSHVVLEKGALVNTLYHFPVNMVYFTTPELLEIGGLPFVTPYEKPTRGEALRYYRRVVDTWELPIAFGETVLGIDRHDGEGGLRFGVRTGSAAHGNRTLAARAVVLATGAYDLANRLGVEGEDLPHVSHYYTEAHAYYRKQVVIVGGANSAADAALELYRSGVHVTVVHRRADFAKSLKYWVRPDLENRIKEGSIAARLEAEVRRITPESVIIEQHGRQETLQADAVFLLTGYHSDTALLANAGVSYDPVLLSPSFDPETYETDVTGIFVVGNVITGRQGGKIFIENGRFHGRRAVEVIADRLRSAAA